MNDTPIDAVDARDLAYYAQFQPAVPADDPEALAHLTASIVHWTADTFELVSRAHADLAKLKRAMDSGAFMRKARKDPAAAAAQIQELTQAADDLTPCGYCREESTRIPTLHSSRRHIEWKRSEREAEAARRREDAERTEAGLKRRAELLDSDTPFFAVLSGANEPWKSAAKPARLHHVSCPSLNGTEALASGKALTEAEAIGFLELRPDVERIHGACLPHSKDVPA